MTLNQVLMLVQELVSLEGEVFNICIDCLYSAWSNQFKPASPILSLILQYVITNSEDILKMLDKIFDIYTK